MYLAFLDDVLCNRASIATVTHHFPKPISSYPRGTRERTIMTLEEEFPIGETERDVGRCVETPDKPEGVLRTETGEKGTPGVPGEPRDEETGERKAANEDRWRLETGEQLREAPKSSRETLGENGGSRHVPGGAWHTQVRSYLRFKLLPEWLQGGKSLMGVKGGLGERCFKEGENV
ncbi:hypothetical protein NDU88_003751 [Pleurodeles waltl]|uniref:Uncharacterized protein n=1 Tax=Pleurodeles waltl TaxID=8319 RepID=A0AAV7T748_PLEWA|nr:hypothetical protein NDU88_003751 [Pleurodeles waltl]